MRLCKKIVLILSVMLFVLGTLLLLVESCVAPVTVPDNPKAGPEIVSVTIHNNPIWKPLVIISDPYTGEVKDSEPGYWEQKGTIAITIKNSTFKPYTDKNGNYINTYYCMFYKGVNSYLGLWVGDVFIGYTTNPIAIYQSDATYTVITLSYGENSRLGIIADDLIFRIQTVEDGYFNTSISSSVFEGIGSAWTEFTITLSSLDNTGTSEPTIKPTSVVPSASDSNNLPTSNPSNPLLQSPQIFYLLVIITTVCIIVIPIVIVLYFSRQRKAKHLSDNLVGFVCEVKMYA